MSIILEIMTVAVVVAVACSLPGVFLVLRGNTMMSDSITHTVLLGIVVAFLITGDLNSPLLIVGATLVGVMTVWMTEALQRMNLMGDDSAIGIVFPLFFSIAIILITKYTGQVHLDTDSVLMGELAFTPLTRLEYLGINLGPTAFWGMLLTLIVNSLFIFFFYKELKLVTFDPKLAAVFGFSPVFLHYLLMTLVSLTAVSAYNSVGSILVVGFMVGPALTGYLCTNRLSNMIGVSIVTATVNSIIGVFLAFWLDVSIAGMIAGVTGLTCLAAFTLSPKRGFLKGIGRQKEKFPT